MYKWIERAAWLTGSLGLAGVFLIFFLQGRETRNVVTPSQKSERSVLKQRPSMPALRPKVDQHATVQVVTKKAKELPQPEKEAPKAAETKNPETTARVTALQVKPEKKDLQTVIKENPTNNTPVALFAESELNQLVGKIKAAHIKTPGLTNCVQIRITRNNNNPQSVTQVERFLTERGYIISGREKEDFLRGSGINVIAKGSCVSVTVGTN